MYGALYKFTGNTYRNRHTLRDMGATWDPEQRAWFLRLGGNGLTRSLWALRRNGVRVEEVKSRHPEPEGPSAEDEARDLEMVYG
jgi:hypothetical protein